MTQEEKYLLLRDLGARLPYGVKGIITYDKSNTTFTVEGIDNDVLHLSDAEECHFEDFKPYLRPMSSMTEEEKKEVLQISNFNPDVDDICDGFICFIERSLIDIVDIVNFISWLSAHHFDYCGLIENGLALEAPVDMYK